MFSQYDEKQHGVLINDEMSNIKAFITALDSKISVILMSINWHNFIQDSTKLNRNSYARLADNHMAVTNVTVLSMSYANILSKNISDVVKMTVAKSFKKQHQTNQNHS